MLLHIDHKLLVSLRHLTSTMQLESVKSAAAFKMRTEHTSYAACISTNFSCASFSLFVSGWYFLASYKMREETRMSQDWTFDTHRIVGLFYVGQRCILQNTKDLIGILVCQNCTGCMKSSPKLQIVNSKQMLQSTPRERVLTRFEQLECSVVQSGILRPFNCLGKLSAAVVNVLNECVHLGTRAEL